MTIAEITTVGLPAVIIPYPFAAGDHQMFNARYLVDKQAASLIAHEEFNAESLATELNRLLTDRSLLEKMGANSRNLAMIGATDSAAQICEQVLYA
jgi:UDP-N-acetylglucosamine--N-acetylmuramyl-(pentapeptide) pyrophosphoryl-undecaprenol N-acetylglucosamine transferase